MKLKSLVIFLLMLNISFAGGISSETDFVNNDDTMLEDIEANNTMASTLMPEDETIYEEDPIEEDTFHIGFYAGGGLSLIALEGENGKKANFFTKSTTQDRQIGVNLIAGYDIIEYLAIEGRALFGVAKAKNTKLQNFALFVKPNMNVVENINIYGLLGYAYSNSAKAPFTDKEAGITWGAGLSYNIKDLIGGYDILIYTDVLNLLHKNKTSSMAALNFGAIYLF